MTEPRPILCRCFDCGARFAAFKQDRLCVECERLEWERRRARGINTHSRRPRSFTARVEPPNAPALPSLAVRLHGRRKAD